MLCGTQILVGVGVMTSSRKWRCPFDMSEVDSHTSGSEASLMAGWSLDPLGEQQAIAMMAAGSALATIHRKGHGS